MGHSYRARFKNSSRMTRCKKLAMQNQLIVRQRASFYKHPIRYFYDVPIGPAVEWTPHKSTPLRDASYFRSDPVHGSPSRSPLNCTLILLTTDFHTAPLLGIGGPATARYYLCFRVPTPFRQIPPKKTAKSPTRRLLPH